MTVEPEDFGVSRAGLDALRGESARENAGITLAVLGGEAGPRRDVVLINAAMALMAAEVAETPREAVAQAAASIDSGKARGQAGRVKAIVAALES